MQSKSEIKAINQKEVVRLIKWLWENPEIKEAICYEDEPSPEECIDIINRLEKAAFYDMILIFILRQQHRGFMYKAYNTLIVDGLVKVWEEETIDNVCQKVKEMLQREFEKAEENQES